MIMPFQSRRLRVATFGDGVQKGDGEDVTQRQHLHRVQVCSQEQISLLGSIC